LGDKKEEKLLAFAISSEFPGKRFWLMEIPVQHEHWQKGEQTSLCSLSCAGTFSQLKYFFVIADAPSAQGIMLKPRTMHAIINEKNLMSAKIALKFRV
jgi:hypothetical protein